MYPFQASRRRPINERMRGNGMRQMKQVAVYVSEEGFLVLEQNDDVCGQAHSVWLHPDQVKVVTEWMLAEVDETYKE